MKNNAFNHTPPLNFLWRGMCFFFYSSCLFIYVLTLTFVASPQTSFGVRLSRIHFSPTDVVRWGEMNAWRTNPIGHLRGGYNFRAWAVSASNSLQVGSLWESHESHSLNRSLATALLHTIHVICLYKTALAHALIISPWPSCLARLGGWPYRHKGVTRGAHFFFCICCYCCCCCWYKRFATFYREMFEELARPEKLE